MRYEVRIGAEAERDLEAIYDYIAVNDSAVNARRLLDALMRVAESLATFPQRGSHPGELVGFGYNQYRQAILKPWRLIYRIIGRQVFIDLVADGRRDLRSLLAQRLLSA